MKQFQQDFFNKPKDIAVAEFKRRVDTFLGPNNVGTKHIEELHDLGYLPIRIKALPEGTLCPISMAGVEAAIMSGMGHMTSFCGSETIPAIAGLEEYYNANAGEELIATPIPDFRGYLKVYPDRGTLQRYGGDSTKNVICSKVRDPKTGQLSGFKIENPEVIEENQDLPLVVIDDLCDGGGTFKGIAQLLESHCPNRDRAIYVTHMVNPKGIATLSENYKEVYFTNSYRDWGREVLPNNVKVIEVV